MEAEREYTRNDENYETFHRRINARNFSNGSA